MSVSTSSLLSWRKLALCILLCYPIMGSKWFPFGGGPRYLSVLVAPICLLLLWQAHRISTLKPLLQEVLKWAAPFTPFVFGWIFAQLWHQYHPVDVTPLSTFVWCGLLFMGARLVGINYRQLSLVAGVAALAYGVIALGEVFWLGRSRAWGGVYENRFGQYAVWLSALAILHFFLDKSLAKVYRSLMLLGALLGLTAAWLSGSRGAILALPVLIVMLMLRYLNWRHAVTLVLALVFALGLGSHFYSSVYVRFLAIYQEGFQYFNEPIFTATSVGLRLELARVALVTWAEHPLFGAGYVSLSQLYATHPNLGEPDPGILAIPGFHSDWFQVIGIGGGLLLSSLLITTLWLFRKAKQDLYRLLFIGFSIVFSVSELFITHNLGLGLLMSCWALYSAAERNQTSPYEAN